MSGEALIVKDGVKFTLKINESTYVEAGTKHQLINEGKSALEIIEVQTGSKLVEEDISRFNDIYGRKTNI